MSAPNYVDVLKNAATSLAEEGRTNQADVLLEATVKLAELVNANLRTSINIIKQSSEEANARLRTELDEARKISDELKRMHAQRCAELDEAGKVIKPFVEAWRMSTRNPEHHVLIQDWRNATVWLVAHPEVAK